MAPRTDRALVRKGVAGATHRIHTRLVRQGGAASTLTTAA
jgi:hypothetical protein